MADRMGQQLGNYRVIRLIGRGGFADVYLGEHLYLKTPVAIKLLRMTVANPGDLESFLKEAQTIAYLVHPNIVRVMDFGVDGETPYLVMDYAADGSLRQRHPRGAHLPLTTILPYVKQVAEALQYAHEEKFIHRDVKPENMLVGRRNALLLSDFGIALIAQSSRYQSTQEVIGTVAYMAPEQIQGKPRPASDQYSLGIVVYEWLSGDHPFRGSFTELCTQHMFASPPPLRGKVPTLAPAVEQVVLTALAKDPHQRFGNVHAFATALEQASQGLRPASIPPQPVFPPPAPQKLAEPPSLPPTQYKGGPPPQEEVKTPADTPLASAAQPPVTQSIQTPVPPVGSIWSGQSPPSTIPAAVPSPAPSPMRIPRKVSRRTVLVGLAATGVIAVAGSGGIMWLATSHPSPTAAPATPSSSGGGTVHMGDQNFLQSSVTISKGSNLTLVDDTATVHIIANGSWVNGSAHPMQENGAPVVNNLQFNGNDTNTIGPFNTAGTFHLYCTVHPGMNLTVVVQ